MASTIKRTTVYVAMGDSTQVFRAPEDMPAALRKKLVNSTRGMNSATILIADRGGREEIRKVLNGEPSALKSRLRPHFLERSLGAPAIDTSVAPLAPGDPYGISWRQWGWRHWAELLLPGLAAVVLWLILTWK